MIDPTKLPDDVTALKAMILAQSEQNARLEALVKALRQAMFGRKSEKIDPDQFELALEDIEAGMTCLEAEGETNELVTPSQTSKPRIANRGSLPKHLERVEIAIEPDETTCSCGAERHVIGEDISERLDVIPAQFRVIVTRRPKYACRSCEDGIVQAPAPASLIAGGIPTEATVAHVLVSKYADHLPLYRQAQIYSRQGIDLERSTLASWVGKAAYELTPVFDCLIQNLKQSSKLFMDETRAPVLDPGRGRTKTGYFWALARDDSAWNGQEAQSVADTTGNITGPPGVAFTYAPGRSGHYADDILQGFSGILQVDGYAGYNRLIRPDRQEGPIQLAYCWAHARRKLHEVARNTTAPIAEAGLKQIAALYRIETDIRGHSPKARLAIRRERSAPRIKAFEKWLHKHRAQVSGKSPLGQALKYIAKYWDGLCLFLSDGRIEIDNNAVERTIRPIALNRKNALFAGHDAGAKNWAIIASLIETAKLNKIEPHAYLTDTLRAIVNGHKQSQIHQLLPWNHTPTV